MSARPHRRSCPCGWTGSYTTASYAERGHNRHSCEVDWSPKRCTHASPHQHGTAAAHKHCGCRCEPCRIAVADQERAGRRNRAYGRNRLVDVAPVRAHLLDLVERGMGTPRIALASGVDRSVIIRIVTGKTRRSRRETNRRVDRLTAESLLAVTWNPADGGAPIDAAETARRLQALVALGWYPSLLARELDMHPAYVDRLLRGRSKASGLIRPGTARRIHAAYTRLAAEPAPTGTYANRARARAAANGWAPPVRVGGRVITGTPITEESVA